MKVLLWLIFLIFPPENPVASPGFSGLVPRGLTCLALRNDKVPEPAKPLSTALHRKTIANGRSLTICKSLRNKISSPLYQPLFLNPLCQTCAGLQQISDLKPGIHFSIYQLGKNNFELFRPMDSYIIPPLTV